MQRAAFAHFWNMSPADVGSLTLEMFEVCCEYMTGGTDGG